MNKTHKYKFIDVNEINSLVKNISFNVVAKCEQMYTNKLSNITNLIVKNPNTYKILLLAGPSSSGKTTTAQLLKDYLRAKGIGAWSISLDDFFLKRENLCTLSNGNPDYESIASLDLPLIHKCLNELVTNSISEFPVFDFIIKERSNFKRTIKIGKKDILILEGLHALNPSLLCDYYSNKCLKVYVSVSTSYIYQNKIIISPQNLRLIRRIIRDCKFRNTPAYETLKIWPTVCECEEKYIVPFKNSAEIFIDSCISYEPCIFHSYLEEIINNCNKDDYFYPKLLEVHNKLMYFNKLNSAIIPPNSILREFIGLT